MFEFEFKAWYSNGEQKKFKVKTGGIPWTEAVKAAMYLSWDSEGNCWEILRIEWLPSEWQKKELKVAECE